MHKTAVYIPQEVKRVLAELAVARGVGEAELIREALRTVTSEARSPRPRLPLFKSGKPGFAEKVDDALRGLASLDPGRHEWAAVRARREPTLSSGLRRRSDRNCARATRRPQARVVRLCQRPSAR
jgi:Ribbon-helix-helix protein, copG family